MPLFFIRVEGSTSFHIWHFRHSFSHKKTLLSPCVNKFEWSSFEDLQMILRRHLTVVVPRLGHEGVDLLAQMLEHVP